MALRVLSRRLSAARHSHHQGFSTRFTKVRYPQNQLITPSRFFSAERVSSPSNLVQIYISKSTDPYLNLSIEHFLLQESPPDSVVLFIYTNRPCIVIGRNQNPWTEVNLGLVNQRGVLRSLRGGESGPPEADTEAENDNDDDVLLVRRRSGGGTVFHDLGNVNYSVICPPATFSRDKHAEMVARGLRRIKKIQGKVRVNERHDIVLDVSPRNETFKISGSAYKLTSKRSLHHGTCLTSSRNLPFLGQLLQSPAAPYIKARGVESVRSPVRNVWISNAEFVDVVVPEFLAMYNNKNNNAHARGHEEKDLVEIEFLKARDAEDIPQIQAGVAELRSRDWIYGQTPQFTFSTHPTADDPRPRPDLPIDLPAGAAAPDLRMVVRHAEITEVAVPSAASEATEGVAQSGAANDRKLADSLKGLHLHHINDWRRHVGIENESMGRWLNGLFGVGG
ncbi:hypothetical protein F5Y01DRAFT_297849 [Xylaria sp. FL0043]|nr:hypothetical protein F5Y01DRAFT_297849 [Xylaria sp. FL0043]